jgi:hypothetical protein
VPDFGAMTYKLTSAGGHNVGELTNDTFSAIAGTLGANPPSVPLRATARLTGSSEHVTLNSAVADERALGSGGGLALVAPSAAGTALDRLLDSFEPAAVTLCTRFRVRELKKPIGFCNPYFDTFAPLTDVARAAALVDSFDLAPLHIRGAAVSMAVKRDFTDDVLVSARGPHSVRAGQAIAVRLVVRHRGGGDSRTLRLRVPIPSGLKPGAHTLVLKGNGFDVNEDDVLFALFEALTGGDGSGSDSPEPRTVRQLAKAVAEVHRKLGIAARFKHRGERVVLESDDVRYDGQVRLRLRVARAHR